MMYSKENRTRRKKHRRSSPLKYVLMLPVLAIAVSAIVFYTKASNAGQEVAEDKRTEITQPTVQSIVKSNTQPKFSVQEVATDTTYKIDQKDEVIPQIYVGEFELPLQGATAYVMANTNLHDETGATIAVNAGSSLQIISEDGDKLIVKTETGFTGSIYSYECMINLPDVIPSIVYRDTNSNQSVFMSSGYSIPNITGEQLYDVEQYNERLGRTEFNMPIIFETAKKVMAAQKAALAEGYSLCIVETYRPLDTQQKVCSNLRALAASEPDVLNGITGNGWSESWFIAQGISNHQRGYAMDVTLVEVRETEICSSGNYAYENVSLYDEVEMPTKIHELSDASIALAYGVKSSSATDWTQVPLASSMNDVAIRLQNYCVNAGFTPLASEWWHFNDLSARNSSAGSLSNGDYFLQPNLSVVPD